MTQFNLLVRFNLNGEREREREREILEKAKPFCTYTYLNKHKMVAHTYYQLGNNVKKHTDNSECS